MKNKTAIIYKSNIRIVSHAICFLMLLVLLVMPALSGVTPVNSWLSDQSSQVFAAESGKSVTIYTSDGQTGVQVIDFDTSFGLDTLVTPAYATGWNIQWKSSNPDVATVDSNGRVLGRLTGSYASKSSGSCYITSTITWNGQKSTDSIKVTVVRGSNVSGNYFTNSIGEVFKVTNTKVDSANEGGKLSGADGSDTAAADGNENTAAVEGDPAAADGNENTAAVEGDTAAADGYENTAAVEGDSAAAGEAKIDDGLEHEHVEGQMLVVFDDDVKKSEIRETLGEHDAKLKQVTELSNDEKAVLATVDSEESLKEAMENVAAEDSVAFVQPNYIYTLDDYTPDDEGDEDDSKSTGMALQEYQQDPYYDKDYQYFHRQMNTADAWKLLDKNGISQTTIVGVIDSGVDAAHRDLKDNLLLEDGKYRRFTSTGDSLSNSDAVSSGHGTHVSGIIAAVYGNGFGGAGVASGASNNYCKVLPAGVVSTNGSISTNAVISGINYAVKKGARVINMSFGGPFKDRALDRCISNHYYKNKIVFVSSAGNKESAEVSLDKSRGTERVECINYPSDMKEVIAVCNNNISGSKHASSYSGLAKDICAPGTEIYSTIPYNHSLENPYTYGALSGTSMSSPMVSGVAALILDANPDLTPAEVRNIICATAYDTSDNYYKKKEVGYGRINAEACVNAAYKAREYAADSGKVNNSAEGSSGSTTGSSSGSVTNTGDTLKLTIKGYFAGQPKPYPAVSQQVTNVATTQSMPKVGSYKTKALKKKIKITFSKALMKTTTKTTTLNQYINGAYDETTSTKTTQSASGVKYQIRVKYGGKTKYCYVSAKKKTSSKFNVSVSGNTVKVYLKKFGSSKLKSKKKYSVSVRPYKLVNKTVERITPYGISRTTEQVKQYGKWSKTVKVKVK